MQPSSPSTARRFARAILAPVVALALAAGMLASAPAATAGKVKPDFFGMHDGRIAYGGFPNLSVGSVRLWDTNTTWRQIENRKGTKPKNWNWTQLDAAIRTAEANGSKPMIVLGQTPQFYAKKRRSQGAYGPGAASMPNVKKWQRYVKAVVKRYRLRAEYQVWNEPNVKQFWNGSPGQMAKLTQTAYKTINKVNKKAKVVSPSMPLRLNSQKKWFKKFWSQKVGRKPVKNFVDIAGVHSYPTERQAPEQGQKLISFAKKFFKKKKIRKPMWNLEVNYGMRGGAQSPQLPDHVQAAYVGRTFLLNAASPVKRVYWYRWDIRDYTSVELSRTDNTTRTAAGNAYNVVRDWLLRSNMKKCKKARNGLYTCTAFKGREGRKFYWKPSGRSIRVKTPRRTTSVRQIDGGYTAANGSTRITVGQSPVMATYRR